MDFPSWTPDWVKQEFVSDFCGAVVDCNHYSEDDIAARHCILIAINSPDCRIVWETLSKHPEREARLVELAAMLWTARWGFGHEEIKQSEKRKIAKDVRKHAKALMTSLYKLTAQDKLAVNSILSDRAENLFALDIVEEIDGFHAIWNESDTPDFVPADTIRRATPAIRRITTNVVSDALFWRLSASLEECLCESLDEWASRTPTVPKPDHENARRLYFIRSLTSNFVEAYGRPMRKETLALAGAFFDCSSLDEAAISRLAPVRNSEKSAG